MVDNVVVHIKVNPSDQFIVKYSNLITFALFLPTFDSQGKGQGHILFQMVDCVGTLVKTNARMFQS